MSSPMFEIPEHFPIDVNEKGEGPETDPDKVVAVVCWCGNKWCRKYPPVQIRTERP